MTDHNLPTVIIVGRPNVGKSSLFNAAVGRRISIVHEESGVTRDRITAPVTRYERPFLLVDTGGLGVFHDENRRVDPFDQAIRQQVLDLLAEADCIIWVVDAQAGAEPLDEEIARLLKTAGRPVIVAANKADNGRFALQAEAEFRRFGFEYVQPISCAHRRGIDDLFSTCVDRLPGPVESESAPGEEKRLKLAFVGRPNVGKSSLVNRILGMERVLVTDVPGTTRDAVDVPFDVTVGDARVPVTLIDTAGFRKRRRVDSPVEYFSVRRAEAAVRRCDVACLVLDAAMPGTTLDRRIAHMIQTAERPCFILANKWDLMREQDVGEIPFIETVRERFYFMDYAPVLCVSALTGYGIDDLLERLARLYENRHMRAPTGILNRFLQDLTARTPPVSRAGRRPFKVYYATMTETFPPEFTLFVNDPEACPRSYLQFLERRIRQAFFVDTGLPVLVRLRRRHNKLEIADGRRAAAAGVAREKHRRFVTQQRRRLRRKHRR